MRLKDLRQRDQRHLEICTRKGSLRQKDLRREDLRKQKAATSTA